MDDETAAYAIVSSIALQGIRLLNPTFGEVIIVYGTGLIGLMAVQLLVSNGCHVIAADIDSENLATAQLYGAEPVVLDEHTDFASQISAKGYAKATAR